MKNETNICYMMLEDLGICMITCTIDEYRRGCMLIIGEKAYYWDNIANDQSSYVPAWGRLYKSFHRHVL